MSIDNALLNAELFLLTDEADNEARSFLYGQIRQSLQGALIHARACEDPEPVRAVEWALIHLLSEDDINAPVRVEVNPPARDPRMAARCSMFGRVRWLVETQGDRLRAAANILRTSPIRTMTKKELVDKLMHTEGMTRTNANMRVDRAKSLVAVTPGVFTESSALEFLKDQKPVRGKSDDFDF